MQVAGQEHDDIAELEALWLSAHGQQRSNQASPGGQAQAAGKPGSKHGTAGNACSTDISDKRLGRCCHDIKLFA